MSDFAPFCVKCRGRHFRHEGCVVQARAFEQPEPKGYVQKVVDPSLPVSSCSECVMLQKRVAELEAKLKRFQSVRTKRNAYQRDYMKKRRDGVALKLNTL